MKCHYCLKQLNNLSRSTPHFFYCVDCETEYTFASNNELYGIWINLEKDGIICLLLDVINKETRILFDDENKQTIIVPYLIDANPSNLQEKINLIFNDQDNICLL